VIVETEAHGGQATVHLSGELDFTTSNQLYTAIDMILTAAVSELTIDLRKVTFCDSSGIHAIMAAYDRATATDAAFHLTHAQAPVERVLKVCGVWDTLTV